MGAETGKGRRGPEGPVGRDTVRPGDVVRAAQEHLLIWRESLCKQDGMETPLVLVRLAWWALLAESGFSEAVGQGSGQFLVPIILSRHPEAAAFSFPF